MGDLTSSPTGVQLSPTSNASDSSGFRSFWRASNTRKPEPGSGVTFVQQDPSSPQPLRGTRISQLFRRAGKTPIVGSADGSEGPGTTAATVTEGQKRRQQVYQAQRRHRNRKAEYVSNLEAEIAKLQRMDAQAHSEKHALAHQNRRLRQLLAAHAIDAGAVVDFSTTTTTTTTTLDVAPPTPEASSSDASPDARVLVGFDPDLGKQRTFLSLPSLQQQHPQQQQQIEGDSWAAVDFILSLEWPCQGHIEHAGINPGAKAIVLDADLGLHGHALTMTSSVYESSMSSSSSPASLPLSSRDWHLPHSEIDKLVTLSSRLPLDDEEITPAQAYAAVRAQVADAAELRTVLYALRIPLAKLATCKGIGTVLPAKEVDVQIGKMVEEVRAKRSM